MTARCFLLAGGLLSTGWAQAVLDQGYSALRAHDYETAAARFRQGLASDPQRAAVRKDLAYTLLKMGENEAARDEFGLVFEAAPTDWHAGLEYAFLCFETKKPREARRMFDRLRRTADPVSRATAEQAFENIDQPLADGITRWKAALDNNPGNFSAHEELARLAGERSDDPLAATHYEAAWRLRPDRHELLIAWGRTLQSLGNMRAAIAAYLAASRGAEPRSAERARGLLPDRYPYVYEFREALALDTTNLTLRRELAYLLLAMNQKEEALLEFETIVRAAPKDEQAAKQLRDLSGGAADPPRAPPRSFGESMNLAEASLRKSYLPDALRFLRLAEEIEPEESLVQLRLGQTLNLMHEDREAIRWFDRARKSKDQEIAREAERAYRNLRPQYARWRTTTWVFPFYSSRWQDAFAYAQVRSELKIGHHKWKPYVSVRFMGDTGRGKEAYASVLPAWLSESSVILGGGITAPLSDHLFAWGEAGVAMQYTAVPPWDSQIRADYRGGFAWFKGWGHLLGSTLSGPFAEVNADAVYVHRYHDDALFVTQGRVGRTFARKDDGRLEWQLLWNVNVTTDARAQSWANFAEMGPGLAMRWRGLPPGLRFGVNFVHGVYLRNDFNPLRPNFNDFRAGCWYAFTH